MPKENLHVIMIPSWFLKEEDKTKGSFFLDQAIALHKQNINISILFSEADRSLKNFNFSSLIKNHFQISKEKEENILVYRYHGWNIYPKTKKLKLCYLEHTYIKLLKKYIDENGVPDLIHAQSSIWAGYIAYKIYKKYNIPYIITEHFTGFQRGIINEKEKKLAKKAFEKSRYNAAVSVPFANFLENYFELKFNVIPNTIDTNFFCIKGNKINSKYFTFINVSFLTYKKGIDVLINAFYKAFNNNKSVRLKLIGDGDERKYLEEMVKKLNLQDRVLFLGNKDRNYIKDELLNSDVYVCASREETFGVSLIEAMSCGLPVISTICGGPEDFINSKVGILIQKNNVNELTKALIDIYNNYHLYDRIYIRNYVKDRFDFEIISKEIINMYKQIIG
ncbi:Glycosyltransferase involved in cell wall bisynthesis [Caloramator quimbayensis]|uniref:Glycosyltransferase involved in cell wall bisynthesis n=1 Tax=Caloramator quimbayensis TaxID=1147123 RepID=A0A1T4XHH4_9CLOT|nr:glycosyltransferase [Caloramator quimbayensis]SKA88585.1 Glycosyltransferase involved in cell wall bisynthesis [Caloramator quimbayensis]